jgi:hypothetical protein
MVIAWKGHAAMHLRHPVQLSTSLKTDVLIQPTGSKLSKFKEQAATQRPHPVQRALSIFATGLARIGTEWLAQSHREFIRCLRPVGIIVDGLFQECGLFRIPKGGLRQRHAGRKRVLCNKPVHVRGLA